MPNEIAPNRPARARARIIVENILHNMAARARFLLGRVESDIGATHALLSTGESVRYVNRVFADYLAYAGLQPSDLQGKRILEVGPGDNLGVALRLYAAGATQVVCVDKFYSRRDHRQQCDIYASLRTGLSDEERARFDEAISPAGSINERAIHYLYGVAAEHVNQHFERGSFDVIVSRAVLWEIHAIDDALRALDRVLRPGGLMIHKIACLDWMFRQNGYHPLEFLTLSDAIYSLVAQDSGKSNRRTIDYYRRAFEELGYRPTIHITRVVGGEGEEFPPGTTRLESGVHYTEHTLQLLRSIRPRLQSRFRELADADLMVEDMFVVAEKVAPASKCPP
jgi:SAM-dependent methyltransferase